MDKERFDVLLELTRLPPASFASQKSPITKTFFKIRSANGQIEESFPRIALAILMNEPVSLSKSSEYGLLLKTKDSLLSRFLRQHQTFAPENALEKWICYFERYSPSTSETRWTAFDLDEAFREHMDEYDVSMKIWRAICESGLERLTSSILWLYYFFRFTPRAHYGHRTADLRPPGIGEQRLSTEKMVILAMNDIEHKPGWKQKVYDDTIIAKWREECTQKSFTKSMFDWMIAALQFKAKSKDEMTGIEMAPPASVFQSDSLIDENLRSDLNNGFDRLLKTDKSLYDWHPGSDGMVLDLIHPSMYCLALRRSHLINPLPEYHKDPLALAKAFLSWYNGIQQEQSSSIFNKEAKTLRGNSTLPARPTWLSPADHAAVLPDVYLSWSDPRRSAYEHKYQWLPTDIHVNSDGEANFLSYINSLSDDELELSLETVVTKFIPMFERVLTIQNAESLHHSLHGSSFIASFRPKGFRDTNVNEFFDCGSVEEFQDWKKAQIKEGKEVPICPPDPYESEDYEEDEEEKDYRHWQSLRKFTPPEVDPFTAPPIVEEKDRTTFKDRTIQIIFKLASVQLSPEKPEYDGGVWHVEGTFSEQICATGIYYLDSLNVTDPTLEFRQKVDVETLAMWRYDQNDHEAMNRMFGDLDNPNSTAQELYVNFGHVSTPGKRAIVFPNTMQHKLSPFKLIDPTKPGHRRMLVMFLVNPFCRVTSTAEISRQQCHERETALAFGVKVDQIHKITLGSLPFDVSHLITKDMMGKSKEAFEEYKRIVSENSEKLKENQGITGRGNVGEEEDDDDDDDDEEDDEEDERYREQKQKLKRVVEFAAPMTFEEACWHRERLMQDRSILLGDPTDSVDNEGWNLCEH